MMAYLKAAYQADELIFPGHIASLQENAAFQRLCQALYGKDWVVYCKPPLAGPEHTLDYLARYTHRVALSNDRIVKLEEDQVFFRYRDSTDHDRIKELALPVFEFMRRFLLHILPDQFVKIRHYGLLSNRHRKAKLDQCRHLLGVERREDPPPTRVGWQELLQRLTGVDPTKCPYCEKGHMIPQRILEPRWKYALPPPGRRAG